MKQIKYGSLGIRIWIFTALLLVGITGAIGYSAWTKYRDNIIEKQEEQMLIVAESLSNNLELTLNQYVLNLNSLSSVVESGGGFLNEGRVLPGNVIDPLRAYGETKHSYIRNIGLYEESGAVLWELSPIPFVKTFGVCTMDQGVLLEEKLAENGMIYFVLRKQLDRDLCLEFAIDMEAYYQKMIADIQVGSNGYIVVKNPDGILFMHPVAEQIGKNVIEGREELYYDVDLKSLNYLIDKQTSERTGVCEYYSYWWSDPSLPRVKKISAFDRADVGDRFLIVSAVMDFDDINRPIIAGFRTIAFTFFGILLVLFGVAGVISYMAVQSRKNKNEIAYLKNLNEVLEETKREEEAIAHQQRLQIMGTMTGGIAHEFNNLLTPIMGYSEMLSLLLPEDSEERDYAAEILDASERAKEIIRQISSLSRKNMETVFSFIPVKKLLNRSVKMIRSVCPANITLTLENNLKEEGFLGSETQLNQVLLNICVNAFHAVGKAAAGEVRIGACLKTREALEEAHQVTIPELWATYICITVQDNGCGMDRETLEQIFNPFFTTKAVGQGTGLGLSVAEQIIHSHKGQIFAESEAGAGSTFFIYLPFAEPNQAVPSENVAAREAAALHLLVISDNGKIRQQLEKGLGKLGVVIYSAGTTAEADQELAKKSYSVLLIDQELSRTGSDDTGICYAMTLKTTFPDLIKLIMTDQIRRETVEAMQYGYIDGYLMKPVSDSQILEEIYRIRNS